MYIVSVIKKYTPVYSRGFTLVEIIVSLAVLSIVSGIILSSLSANTNREALNKNVDAVASVFVEARSLTISSKNASRYGVHLGNTGPTVFTGTAYNSENSSNRPLSLNSRVSITNIFLAGGGGDVVFDKFTGNTSHNGTFRITVVGNSSQYKTITVHKTGLVEVQ